MSIQAGTRDLRSLLTQKAPAQAVAQWIFREGLLPQFTHAKKESEEQDQMGEWYPIEELDI
jgi:hypothetical protein